MLPSFFVVARKIGSTMEARNTAGGGEAQRIHVQSRLCGDAVIGTLGDERVPCWAFARVCPVPLNFDEAPAAISRIRNKRRRR